jgi:uncharacterized protein
MEEIIALIIMITVFGLVDWATTYGLKKSLRTVKPWIKKGVWGLHIYGILNEIVFFLWVILVLDHGPPRATWFSALVMGGLFVFLVPKIVYCLFLLAEFFVWVFMRLSRDRSKPIPTEPSRRRFIGQSGLMIASIPFASFLWGVTKGKYDFQVKRIPVYFDNLPEAFEGFTITQISDIHSGSFTNFEAVQCGVDMIAAQKSDLLLFTGDLVNSVADEIVPFMGMFGGLSAPFGKFSTLGNHDYGEYENWDDETAKEANLNQLKKYHADMGYRLLNNESLLIEKDGQTIRLAGVENWGKPPFPSKGDLDLTFAGSEQEREFTVLMSHDPSHWDYKVLDFPKHVDLTLSGHTHGMQFGVEIPGWKWSPVKYFYPRWAGLYEEKGQKLYVNRGFGFIGFPGRVGILPEITVLELRRTQA